MQITNNWLHKNQYVALISDLSYIPFWWAEPLQLRQQVTNYIHRLSKAIMSTGKIETNHVGFQAMHIVGLIDEYNNYL